MSWEVSECRAPELLLRVPLSGPTSSPNASPVLSPAPWHICEHSADPQTHFFSFLSSQCRSLCCWKRVTDRWVIHNTSQAHLSSSRCWTDESVSWPFTLSPHCGERSLCLIPEFPWDFLEQPGVTAKIKFSGEMHLSIYFMGFATIQKLQVSWALHCQIQLSNDHYKSTDGML